MIEKLKAPFWFGLPGYAWLVGGIALVGGAIYFLKSRSSAAATAQSTPAVDNSGVLNPYPSGGGTPVPPSSPIDPNGAPPPPRPAGSDPGAWRGAGSHDPATPAARALSEHEKEWLKLHPDYTVEYERAHKL